MVIRLGWAAAIALTMASPVGAQQIVLQGSGSGGLDVPAQNNAAVAWAQCTFDRGAQTVNCSSRVYNIVDLIAAHIHIGGPGTSGPVVIPIPNLPLHVSGLRIDEVMDGMARDKKIVDGRLRFVLPLAIGDVRYGIEVAADVVRGVVAQCLSAPSSAELAG